MKLYLTGLKSYHLDLGIEYAAFSDPRLERTLHGIKRDHNEPGRRQRTPLTRPHLLLLLSKMSLTDYNDVVLRAAFTLAFAAFLCMGQFTYKRTDIPTGPHFGSWFLTKSSIRLTEHEGEQLLELTLPASKTDPFRHGVELTIAASNDPGCPVYAMKQFLRMDTHRPLTAPLFCVGILQQLPFTREYVVQKLQRLAMGAGLGHEAWNGHSFRRGAATWAAQVGISETQIQTLGRWR